MIGLAGAHRTGKTSLARESARALGLPFVETSVSEIFRNMGLDPAEPMDFQTRLIVQSVVLKVCQENWARETAGFLSDRTPIDMLAYTMAEVKGETLDYTTEALLAKYLRDCINAANRHFSLIMLVQPGIPIVAAPGKAALSIGYMEHLNALMAGFLVRKDLSASTVFLRRDTLDMQDRINCVIHSYKRIIKSSLQERSEESAIH